MASTYSSFMQAPTASHLASDATLNYITTTTFISEPSAIIKHLQAQLKQVTKKDERVLNTIEGPDSLFLETELTLQFMTGGGAYLPSMDANLLDEKLVIFPILHVVSFDADGKIKQIRLHWDQGTLLKQVEAIGKTGRNWPIRDGKAQVEAITKSLKSSGTEASAQSANGSHNGEDVVVREHKKSSTRGDPHASLDLFAPRDPNEHAPGDYQTKLAPRASAKPPPRDYTELFSGESPAADAASNSRSVSPSKADGVIFKSGAGKHYTGNRLFDHNEGTRSPERKKVFSQKNDHFEFGDGEDAPQASRPANRSTGTKGAATFSFEDFSTPIKPKNKLRPDDHIHWGAEDPPSPPKRPVVHAARKDADPSFNFADDGTPAETNTKSPQRQRGMNIYNDPTAAYEGDDVKQSQSNVTSTDNNRRGNDFGAHYSMTDTPQDENMPPPSNKRATRSDLEQHWAFSEPKAEQKVYKTAGDGMGGRKGGYDWMAPEGDQKIYKTAGDGMGGRKTGTGGRSWGIGDDSDPEVDADVRSSARSRRAQA